MKIWATFGTTQRLTKRTRKKRLPGRFHNKQLSLSSCNRYRTLPYTISRSAGGAAVPATTVIASGKDGQSQLQKPSEKPTENEAQPAWLTDRCGLELNAKVWEGPQRIKTTQLDERTQGVFKEHLKRIFDTDTLLGKKASWGIMFTLDEITTVIDAVLPLLESEPMLIEDVPNDVVIVGDLHGQLYDLDRVFRLSARDGRPGWECAKHVFLGNYVDRGRQSIEVVMALFCIKCLHPDRVYLLRGNHELASVNKRHGFLLDCMQRFSHQATAKHVYIMFNEAFAFLSIAGIVGNAYFCAHGGISTSGFTRRHMRALCKPVFLSDEDTLIRDIIWSDPAIGLKGSAFNTDRATSIYFGCDELCKALASMEVIAVFRGHSRIQNGYEPTWHLCFTVFSATNTNGLCNSGAVAHVGPAGQIQFTVLKENHARSEWEQRLRDAEFKPDGRTIEEKTQDPENGIGTIRKVPK